MAMQRYRCVTPTPLNLGGFEPPESISPGEIILWDGSGILQREDNSKLSLKNQSGFKALIKTGWMVLEDSPIQVSKARPAGIQMHEAAPKGANRAEVKAVQVDDEERDVGGIGAVRANANTGAVPNSRQASDTGKVSPPPERKLRGHLVVGEEPQEGVVIGKFKNSARAPNVDMTKINDRQFVERVSNVMGADPVAIERVPATSLAENFRDEGVSVHSTQSGLGGEEHGRLVGKIGAIRTPVVAAVSRAGQNPPDMAIASDIPEDVVEALQVWSEYGTTPDGSAAYSEPQLQALVKLLLEKHDEALAEVSSLQELVSSEPLEFSPEPDEYVFNPEWNLGAHWKTRHSRVMTEFSKNRQALVKILAIDDSVGVQKAAQLCLSQLGE